jgi:hypothetical protein
MHENDSTSSVTRREHGHVCAVFMDDHGADPPRPRNFIA